MPEPFKNLFNTRLIAGRAKHLKRVSGDFPAARFRKLAGKNLKSLELKQRSEQICDALTATLPENFNAAVDTLLASLHPESRQALSELVVDDKGLRGWAIMPMAEFIARHGLHDPERSLQALQQLTSRFTAEFAIRPFLLHHPEISLVYANRWAVDDNEHVRRLASEGTRPRLPWGMRLHAYVKDPSPLMPILEKLKDDHSEYVRRSVANSLNDIARDHPAKVAEVAGRWLQDASTDRERLVKHACRSLIKMGHPATLKALGYVAARVRCRDLSVSPECISMGASVVLAVTLGSTVKRDQPLIVDYIVHHQKANGSTSPKVFKWKTFILKAGESLCIEKRHSFKRVTTRVYYPGIHRVTVQINGKIVAEAAFELKS